MLRERYSNVKIGVQRTTAEIVGLAKGEDSAQQTPKRNEIKIYVI